MDLSPTISLVSSLYLAQGLVWTTGQRSRYSSNFMRGFVSSLVDEYQFVLRLIIASPCPAAMD